jgi:hypothetical protein
MRWYASMYRPRVAVTTSGGSGGSADTQSQPEAGPTSQSRTSCLSNDGGGWPGGWAPGSQ